MPSKEIIKRLRLRRAPGVKPRDLILTALLKAGKNGLSQKLLVDKTGLSRDKVYDDCKMLEEKEGLVRHESKGRRTTYYATREIFDNLSLRQQIFGKEVFSKIQDNQMQLIIQYGNKQLSSEHTSKRSHHEANFSEEKIKRILFDFSLRLGAIITYILIQAMNPATIKELTHNEKISGRSAKDYLVEKWVQNVISPLEMLKALRKSLPYPGYGITIDESEQFSDFSSYQVTGESIDVLLHVFGKLYPTIHKQLEKINQELPNTLEEEKKAIEQAVCKHDFGIQQKDREDENKDKSSENEVKDFECKKCKFHVPVPISALITNKEIVAKLDQQKPPKNSCAKFGHQWTKRSDYYVAFTSFHCALCGELVRFPVEKENKLRKIEEVVSLKLEDRNVALCNDIEYFFHINNNQQLTIKDFMKFFEGFRPGIRIRDPKIFIETVSSILDILVRHEYIKELNISDDREPLKRVFIRKEQLNI